MDKDDELDPDSLDEIKSGEPGQHFHMDFGFVRGTKFKSTDAEGRTVYKIYMDFLICIETFTNRSGKNDIAEILI